MQVQLDINYRGHEIPDRDIDYIRQRVAKLERLCNRITALRIVVEHPQRHREGNLFGIKLYVSLPRGEVSVNREPPQHTASEDVHVAIRDAFDAVERRVQDHVRRHQGQVKVHGALPRGFNV